MPNIVEYLDAAMRGYRDTVVGSLEMDQRADVLALDAITITDAATFEAAGLALTRVNGERGRLEDHRKALTAPLLDAKRAIDDAFREPIAIRDAAMAKAKRAIADYAAKAERARLEAERIQREQQAEEAARLRAEQAAAEEAGDIEKAITLNFEAEMVSTPIAPSQRPKVAGVSMRETWSFEVADLNALIRAAAENPAAYAQYLMPREAAIGAAVRAQKESFAVPGIVARKSTGVAAGKR